MAMASMTMSVQTSQQLGRPHTAARSQLGSRPCALPVVRPAFRAARRPAAFRPAAQWSGESAGPGFSAKWSCGPNGFTWNTGAGPRTIKNMKDLWKEFERMDPELKEMSDMWREFQKTRNDGFARKDGFAESEAVRNLPVDIEEDDAGYTLIADVPGLAREDLKVQVDKERFLTISGERKRAKPAGESSEAEDKYKDKRQRERTFGKFSRKLKLPDDADVECISARTEAGVLYLSIRRMADAKPSVVDVPIY